MKKKVLCTFLATGMLLSVLGCGDKAMKNEEQKSSYEAEGTQEENPVTNGTDISEEIDWTVSYNGIKKGAVGAKVSVHDPSIYEENGVYYIFGSHMATAKSTDGRVWEYVADGYSADNSVYDNLWADGSHVFDYAGEKDSVIGTDDGRCHVWAPDVIYNKAMGCYTLYYCTSSTWNASNLCWAKADNVEGPYVWQGALIYSGFTENNIDSTDVLNYVDREYAVSKYIKPNGEYNFVSYPNAIDPTIFYDADDRLWMVYGSWSGGIFLLEINEETGEVIHPEADEANEVDPYFGKRLLGGDHKSIEAPYILYEPTSEYYYLFVSYGSLTRDGGYQIRVFRSKQVDGPYVDMNGVYPTEKDSSHAGSGLKLSGNYNLPSLNYAYKATGHNSALISSEGKLLIAYHTRFATSSEYHEPRMKQFFINKEGWPCVLPYAYDNETIQENGYSMEQMAGMYYFINQNLYINSELAMPLMMKLTEEGKVLGDGIEGTWTFEENSAYMTITYNDTKDESHTYSGVFCIQNDEAGTEVMTFSAVGCNKSIWGVKYGD